MHVQIFLCDILYYIVVILIIITDYVASKLAYCGMGYVFFGDGWELVAQELDKDLSQLKDETRSAGDHRQNPHDAYDQRVSSVLHIYYTW